MPPFSVYVTGASSGIGRALALEYAKRGAKLYLTARRPHELENTAADARKLGGRATVERLDVTDADAVKGSLRRAAQDLGRLDMVIANAGIGVDGSATTMPWEAVDEVLATNVRGAFATLVHAIPILIAEGGGHIVGISSLAGRRGLPLNGAYSASKAALSAFLDTLRIDLARASIRVTDVRPGFIDTPIIQRHGYDLPLVWPVERAARVIADRLESGPASITFPWPLVLLAELGRLLPASIYDPLVRRLAERRAAAHPQPHPPEPRVKATAEPPLHQ